MLMYIHAGSVFIIVCRSVQHCLAHGEDDLQQLEQDSDTTAGPCDSTAENIVARLTDGNAEMVCIISDTVQLNSLKQSLYIVC